MDDLISRKVLLEKAKPDPETGEGIVWAQDICEAPAVEAEPVRHGRWLFDDFDGDGLDYQCSACEMYSHSNHNYCPHCGARMGLEE